MTEDKLTKELWKRYHGTDGHGFRIVIEEAFALAIRTATFAQRRGCAETWLKDIYLSLPETEIERRKLRETSEMYTNILNAEPEEV